jgi:hypothetical protein
VVPDFTCRAEGTQSQLAIQNEASTYASSDGNEKHILRGKRIAEGKFPQGCHTRIVQQGNGSLRMQREGRSDFIASPLLRKIGQEDNGAGLGIDQSRQPDSDGQNLKRVFTAQIVEQAAGSIHCLGRAVLRMSWDHRLGNNVAASVRDNGRDFCAAKIHTGKIARTGITHEAALPLELSITHKSSTDDDAQLNVDKAS